MAWHRVNRKNPCAICGKFDWCTYTDTGVCCMRVESGRPLRNGGWWHKTGDKPRPVCPPVSTKVVPPPDLKKMLAAWAAHTTPRMVNELALTLGVAANALVTLRAAWSPIHRAWAFPMCNASGEAVGVRLRAVDGRKWSVTGGREGLFLPALQAHPVAFLPEGPTDTAAVLSLGLYAIGRPSCSGGIAMAAAALPRLGVRRAVIVCDNDADKVTPAGQVWNPGVDGARKLAADIGVPACIFVPPTKDIRQLVINGCTRELLINMVDSLVWHQPRRSQ